ncbi:MAG: hypothetical protein HYS41_03875 [Candidatus Omnitrophica bacterium]|nr:hypothetical protein [Candidatus Omnitrophota bacterium]
MRPHRIPLALAGLLTLVAACAVSRPRAARPPLAADIRALQPAEGGGAAMAKQLSEEALPPVPAGASLEPTIRELHQAAIRYAEVGPEKIRRWRTGAVFRNLLPKFTVSLDRDRNRTIASSTSAGKTTFTVGPEDESLSVDFDFTWDLANLIWNTDQTSIDVRSRLMVLMRQKILEEATQAYFERKRLLLEFKAQPTDDPVLQSERALRVAEITAKLDALTGGWYSAALKQAGDAP